MTSAATHDIFAALRARTIAALAELLPDQPPEAFARVVMEPPRDPTHGDMATNAALVVAKAARLPPPKLAAALAEKLSGLPEVESAAPAGPGFVNLRLREVFIRSQLPIVLAAGEAYGDTTVGAGRRVNVEYVSANPTGPLTVGHCRGAVVGDALANLLGKAGWAVTKEYYVNDAGAQVQALAWAAYWRYLAALLQTYEGKESADAGYVPLRDFSDIKEVAAREKFEARFGLKLQYGGDYLVPVGQALHDRYGHGLLPADGGQPTPDTLALVQKFTVDAMLASIREDLAALGVRHDVFVSETDDIIAKGKVEQAEALLAARGLIYTGVLEPPRGKTPDDWEPRPQVLFRATRFGDEVDRPLRKSDGSGTYFANDIANHLHKIERGFTELVHVWGADHGGYVKRMQAAVAALSDGAVPLEIVLTQIVHVVKDGQPMRMSKRAGTYVTLADLIEEVGQRIGGAREAVRFTMLTRKPDAQMEFDLDRVVEQSRENPVFYVQYAHARCRSVLRTAADHGMETSPATLAATPLDSLTDPVELALIRRLAAWPRTVDAAATAREPHRIAFFLHDLAADFHLLWNRGREDATLRFIQVEDPAATLARLALVAATAMVIRSGLAVMGVTPVEEMR